MWIALYQHSQTETAIVIGDSGSAAADAMLCRFPGLTEIIVAKLYPNICYAHLDDFENLTVARKDQDGSWEFSPLPEHTI